MRQGSICRDAPAPDRISPGLSETRCFFQNTLGTRAGRRAAPPIMPPRRESASSIRSICVLIGLRKKDCGEQDPDVQPNRPVIDVIQIEGHTVAKVAVAINISAETIDLRPSGD